MNSAIKKVTRLEEIQQCFAIRQKVFVEGQNVPLSEDIDGKDHESSHYLLSVDGIPAGAARVRFINDYAKIERVAILEAYQRQGLGKKIMEYILEDLKCCPNIMRTTLSSQTYAIPFYERLGFKVCSDEYVDAGILHKDMRLDFY